MFSYVFMKILEMRPRSYDKRIDKISSGRVRAIKEAVVREIEKGSYVLDIGCGTGELASMLVKQSCRVEGFDLSPGMVEAAKERIETENLAKHFTLREMGVENMDNLPGDKFDAVVATLVFSELSDDERRFALKHAQRVLRSGARLIIADEVVPRKKVYRLIHFLARIPLVAITFLVSRRLTRPIAHLAEEMKSAGFDIDMEQRSQAEAFTLVIGRKKNSEARLMETKDKSSNSSVMMEG